MKIPKYHSPYLLLPCVFPSLCSLLFPSGCAPQRNPIGRAMCLSARASRSSTLSTSLCEGKTTFCLCLDPPGWGGTWWSYYFQFHLLYISFVSTGFKGLLGWRCLILSCLAQNGSKQPKGPTKLS
jgi:hypothetical protein